MVEEKGLAPESADKIGGFVKDNKGDAKDLWAKLTAENKFGDHPVSWGVLGCLSHAVGTFRRKKIMGGIHEKNKYYVMIYWFVDLLSIYLRWFVFWRAAAALVVLL